MFALIKVSFAVVVIAIVFANLYDYYIEETAPIFSMAGEYEAKKEKFREPAGKRAFVLGGTGEVGKEVVKALLRERLFSKVVLLGRRLVTYDDELYKDVEQKVIDFDNLDEHVDDFKGFEAGYSCLGTTRGKSGADGFYKVDHDYVVNTAKLAIDGGCKQFHLISSVGASANSSFLYPKTKGQVEEEIKAMKFDNLFIYRPALLLCDRAERRAMEKVFIGIMKPFTYMFPTAVSVPTSTVAMACMNRTLLAVPGSNGVETLENKEIHRAAGKA